MTTKVELKNDYKLLDNVLQEVYNAAVKIRQDEERLLVKRFQKVIDTLITKMKEVDPDGFGLVFNRIGYTGSFYEGLRIGEATEYDLNIILKPKIHMELIQNSYEDYDGCIRISTDKDCEKPMSSWVDNGTLSPKKVRQWLQGIVSKTIIQNNNIICNCTIHIKKSGPATTLLVKSKEIPTKDISVDLVPVFEFKSDKWPPIKKMTLKPKEIMKKKPEEKAWFVVPKKEDKWRTSFPLQERSIMDENLNLLKYTLKLMKKTRDEFNIHKVASYHIKTLFLWELEKNNHAMWSSSSPGPLFIHMLHKFRDALKDGNIPFYWDTKCNMIGSVSPAYLENNYNQINNFIKRIDTIVNSDKKDVVKKDELTILIRVHFHLPSDGHQESDNEVATIKMENMQLLEDNTTDETSITEDIDGSVDPLLGHIICQNSQHSQTDEIVNLLHDSDHVFALSLLPYLKQLPTEVKLDAHLEILTVLKKYSINQAS